MDSYVIAIIPRFNGAYYQTTYLDFETRGQNITQAIYGDPVRLHEHFQRELRVLLQFWVGEIPRPQTQSLETSEMVKHHRQSEPMTECTYLLVTPPEP